MRALGLAFLLACSPRAASVAQPYPCTLQPLASLTPDFTVRQHLEATGHGRSGGFDTVLQKKGDTLVLVGLAAGVRAFVLQQRGTQVSFEQSMGPALPFPAEYAIIDIHRVYFKRLPHGAETGTVAGELDGEHVEETWSNARLLVRRFTRPGEREGAVTIEYGDGCTAEKCFPASVRITNDWLGYVIDVKNGEFTPL